MSSTDKSPSVILYPCPGMGHLRPMIELAKLLHHHHNLPVTILIVQPHYHHGSFAPYLSHAISSNPSLSFRHLPPITPPSASSAPSSPHRAAFVFQLLHLSNPDLLSFLTTFSQTTPISALVADFFSTCSLDVASQLSIPTYIFFPSAASFLSLVLHLPTLHSRFSATTFRQLGSTLVTDVPGLPDLPAHHMPLPILDGPADDAYNGYLSMSRKLPCAQGFVVNTFDSLEKKAVGAISNVDGRHPPLYCVGPIVSTAGDERPSECLPWLDRQPRGSVVFLCFGSMGSFSVAQLAEIAAGLERSGQRFLWVVRSVARNQYEEPEEAEVAELLPEGFLERTRDKGMVVKAWAPQAAVLEHEAVGGFVSHCGWNSTLEAVSAGVAVIAWPLYAEQKMNKVFLVEEAKVAVEVEVEGSGDEEGMVKAEEVEKKVRWLMETEGGREMKERMRGMKESAVRARMEGGTSHRAMAELAMRLKVMR